MIRLHIVGDLFDRGPRPDMILERLYQYHDVDFQWGNHDVVWMGAAAGSPLCILTVLKTTLAYNNVDTLERGYGIPLRCLEHYAEEYYAQSDLTRWMPHADPNATDVRPANLARVARMHKAVTVLMLKLEAEVIAATPILRCRGATICGKSTMTPERCAAGARYIRCWTAISRPLTRLRRSACCRARRTLSPDLYAILRAAKSCKSTSNFSFHKARCTAA